MSDPIIPPLRNGINPEKMLEDHLPTEINELKTDIENLVTVIMDKSTRLTKLQVLELIINHEP